MDDVNGKKLVENYKHHGRGHTQREGKNKITERSKWMM